MTTKPAPDFPSWIPSAARDTILELRQRADLTPEQLAALDRLANSDCELMHTEVWQRLPPSAAGKEGRIIVWTVLGLGFAAAIRPPFPKNRAEAAKHLAKYPDRWPARDAATLASSLLEAMDENRQDAEGTRLGPFGPDLIDSTIWEAYLQTMCPGQKLSYLEARNIVERLALFFEVLWGKDQAFIAALKLPRLRKKQAADAKEIYLSRFLSQRFVDHFGDAYDPIVGALVGVALGSKHSPDAATIRGRRRGQRKISSKK
jgi:hypothetical protein